MSAQCMCGNLIPAGRITTYDMATGAVFCSAACKSRSPSSTIGPVPGRRFACEAAGCGITIPGDAFCLGIAGGNAWWSCEACYKKITVNSVFRPGIFIGPNVTYDPVVVAPAAKRKKCDCSREKIMSVGCKDHA